ncbi:MAG TPA: serine hydrolase [Pseudohongiella sp.]|nr:serine hydrolase [Pseudohongiella sp.]
MTSAHISFRKPGTALFLLLLISTSHAQNAARWLDPALDEQNLPRNSSILFWSGDQQIAGFRNIAKVSAVRHIQRSDQVSVLPEAPRDLSSVKYTVEGQSYSLDDYMVNNHVGGLLVLKDGAIALERYGLGNRADHLWVSFSMTKSVVSMLTGAAIKDGYIRSVDDPVTHYLPQLLGTSYEGVSVRHVLQMASGTAWDENYADPRSDVATMPNDMLALMKFMGAKPRVATPGERFNYNTGETNLAGAIVRAAIGNNLAAYLTEKIWKPLGMESDATWISHGPNGGELGGCCISPTLKDWGRLALFAMNDGVLPDGTRVLPENWMRDSTTPSPASANYGYLWWLDGDGIFRASGIFGQGIYLNPQTQTIIVVQGAWPQATNAQLAAHRDAMFRAVDRALNQN